MSMCKSHKRHMVERSCFVATVWRRETPKKWRSSNLLYAAQKWERRGCWGWEWRLERKSKRAVKQRKKRETLLMRAQHRRRLNVTNGSAKREGEWQGDTGFMRQVLRCGGSIQYFPSDSAPTANQTQMRNTNTCTVAQKLQCNPGIFPSSVFFPLSMASPPPVALIVHRALKEDLWLAVIKGHVAVHHTISSQNGFPVCTGCNDGLRPTLVFVIQLGPSSCWCAMSCHAPLLSWAT